jgi:hypothetical protein
MYKIRCEDGLNNVSGKNIKKIRQAMRPKVSQRKLALMMQLNGIDIDKNVIRRIESGERFVTDIDIIALAKVLAVSYEQILDGTSDTKQKLSIT